MVPKMYFHWSCMQDALPSPSATVLYCIILKSLCDISSQDKSVVQWLWMLEWIVLWQLALSTECCRLVPWIHMFGWRWTRILTVTLRRGLDLNMSKCCLVHEVRSSDHIARADWGAGLGMPPNGWAVEDCIPEVDVAQRAGQTLRRVMACGYQGQMRCYQVWISGIRHLL